MGKIAATALLYAINARWGEPPGSYAFALCLIILAVSPVPALGTWDPIVIPAIAFAVLACARRDWFSASRWLLRGRASPATWLLFAVTIPLTAGALVGWANLVQPDLTVCAEMTPGQGLDIVLAAAIVLCVFNAVAEEVVFRGVLWQALVEAGLAAGAVLIIQAAAFGIMHFTGVPNGAAGSERYAIVGADRLRQPDVPESA